jgi:hypothetical protein
LICLIVQIVRSETKSFDLFDCTDRTNGVSEIMNTFHGNDEICNHSDGREKPYKLFGFPFCEECRQTLRAGFTVEEFVKDAFADLPPIQVTEIEYERDKYPIIP